MILLGKDVSAEKLLSKLEGRLRARGLYPPENDSPHSEGIEPNVDPLSFNLHGLTEHADPTRGLPLSTHRGGIGRSILLAKWAFRKSCQVFINEALARQKIFNGHVRDSYAQLSAEVLKLREEVESLKGRKATKARKPGKRA